ncbi:hypothetical protein ACOME3_001255 [Neoechinorhynchus agilis]
MELIQISAIIWFDYLNDIIRIGRTPLSIAVYHNYSNTLIDILLEYKADVLIIDVTNDRYSLLHYACLHGNTSLVRKLLLHGCPVNQKSLFGETPVHLAVSRGFIDIVRILMTYGNNQITILHIHFSIGCSVTDCVKNTFNDVSIIHAAITANCTFEIFKQMTDLLIEQGAKLTNFEGMHCSNDGRCRSLVMSALLTHREDRAKYLIQLGAPIHDPGDISSNVWRYAFATNQKDIMDLCFKCGLKLEDEPWILHLLFHMDEFEMTEMNQESFSRFVLYYARPRPLKDICRLKLRKRVLLSTSRLYKTLRDFRLGELLIAYTLLKY